MVWTVYQFLGLGYNNQHDSWIKQVDDIAPIVTGVWQLTVIKARKKLVLGVCLLKEGKQSLQLVSSTAGKQEVLYLKPNRYRHQHASVGVNHLCSRNCHLLKGSFLCRYILNKFQYWNFLQVYILNIVSSPRKLDWKVNNNPFGTRMNSQEFLKN